MKIANLYTVLVSALALGTAEAGRRPQSSCRSSTKSAVKSTTASSIHALSTTLSTKVTTTTKATTTSATVTTTTTAATKLQCTVKSPPPDIPDGNCDGRQGGLPDGTILTLETITTLEECAAACKANPECRYLMLFEGKCYNGINNSPWTYYPFQHWIWYSPECFDCVPAPY